MRPSWPADSRAAPSSRLTGHPRRLLRELAYSLEGGWGDIHAVRPNAADTRNVLHLRENSASESRTERGATGACAIEAEPYVTVLTHGNDVYVAGVRSDEAADARVQRQPDLIDIGRGIGHLAPMAYRLP